MEKKPLIVLTGPTAVGKTKLSIRPVSYTHLGGCGTERVQGILLYGGYGVTRTSTYNFEQKRPNYV